MSTVRSTSSSTRATNAVRRVYHNFAYPRDEDTGVYYTEGKPSSVSGVLGIEEPEAGDDPGVMIDGPGARATIPRDMACR